MFFLGLLGIFQVLFLPGILIKKFIALPRNFFFSLASVVALSLITNYTIVILLTIVGLFLRWLVLTLIILEFAAIIYLYRDFLFKTPLSVSLTSFWNTFVEGIKTLLPSIEERENVKLIAFIRFLVLLIAIIIGIRAIEWIYGFFTYNLGEVFNTWDTVVSWNRWATEWAANRMPMSTDEYPQLIPANWALIYKIIGTSQIQLFAKAIMPLFSLLILFLLFGLGVYTKNPGYFLSVEIARLMIKKFSGNFITSGYVDLPLAFMVLLAFSLLYLAHHEKDKTQKFNWLSLSLIVAAGSAVTKQPGLYALFALGMVSLLFVMRSELKTIFSENRKKVIVLATLVALIVLPWYLYIAFQIIAGTGESHLLKAAEHTNQAYKSSSLFANLLPGLQTLGKYMYLFLFILPAAIFIEKFWRMISIFVTFPYILIWAAYASYDSRNLTMVFPLVALLVGIGLIGIIDFVFKWMRKIQLDRLPTFAGIGLIVLSAAALSFVWTDTKLEQQQAEKQKQIFSAEINEQLYTYFADTPIEGKILTSYPVNFLQDFENTQITYKYQDEALLEDFLSNEDIAYLLYPLSLSSEMTEYIAQLHDENRIETLFTADDWIPYGFAKINR